MRFDSQVSCRSDDGPDQGFHTDRYSALPTFCFFPLEFVTGCEDYNWIEPSYPWLRLCDCTIGQKDILDLAEVPVVTVI